MSPTSIRITCSTATPRWRSWPGFAHNRRVMVSGLSRHRQIDPYRAGRRAAELALRARQPRQPISRIDLVGKDAIVIRDGMQVTEFKDGILPWACSTMSRWSSTNTTPAART
jgi:hypothetical protein